VGLFTRRADAGLRSAGRELTDELRGRLTPRFEAVGEALFAGVSAVEACWVVGRAEAEVGSALGESLEELRAATRLVAGRDPLFEESHALASAWSESALGYLHGLSCADPLTGLSTHAHIRERIAELYRGSLVGTFVAADAVGARGEAARAAHSVSHSHALVIADTGWALDPISAARRLTLLGQTVRTVFDGNEPIGQVGHSKVVVVALRNEALASRVSLLRRMAARQAGRIWIEGLPATDASAARLLDELARG
jgi:hypothetical protein